MHAAEPEIFDISPVLEPDFLEPDFLEPDFLEPDFLEPDFFGFLDSERNYEEWENLIRFLWLKIR